MKITSFGDCFVNLRLSLRTVSVRLSATVSSNHQDSVVTCKIIRTQKAVTFGEFSDTYVYTSWSSCLNTSLSITSTFSVMCACMMSDRRNCCWCEFGLLTFHMAVQNPLKACKWKYFWNRPILGEVVDKSIVYFLVHGVDVAWSLSWCRLSVVYVSESTP